jgi:hypothetical protein
MAEFKRGDYVWAKLTGYPFWPAKINSAEQAGPKGASREVLFLGTKQRAVVLVKNLKSVNEDRAKMVRQRNTGRFLQAVAELNEVAPPPDSLAQELENAPGKKGKKGKKRKKGEAATAATNDAAKKAKTEKPAGKKAKNQNAKKAALSRTKKSSTSTQDGDVSGPSGEKNEAVSSFEISQSETDGDKVFTTESKQYHK